MDAAHNLVDPLFGGTNLTTLLADALLMTGLFFLGRGVLKTGEYRPRLVRTAVSAPALLVALLAVTASSLFIDSIWACRFDEHRSKSLACETCQ